jgi:pimeloyl-ACP methyl ester carboxylesterase
MPRPAWLPRTIFPFDIAGMEIDRTPVAVTEAGAGPTLLFYTGVGLFTWRDLMLHLLRDFHCVAVDPPGIGLSTPIARADVTLRRSARTLATVIERLGLRDLTLVAHDTAGPPAFAAAARLVPRVRGLVAVNTFGWKPSGAVFRGMLGVMGNGVMRRFSLATGALAKITASSFGAGRHLDAASRRAYRDGYQHSMPAFHDYLRDARDSDLYDDVARALSDPLSALPLLTVFGARNDPLHFQPRWKALFPHARQVVVPNGNHFPMCDDPAFVAAQIRQWHRDAVARSQEPRS